MTIETWPTGSFGANCVILTEGETCLLVDPGSDGAELTAHLESKGRMPAAILLTHAHFDHISAVPDLLKRWPETPVYAGAGDHPFFGHPFNQYGAEYPGCEKPATLRTYDEGEMAIGSIAFRAIPTPGHTPGGVCLAFASDGLLLTGDTLFAGSIGRTDLPGGSAATLRHSLAKLKALEGTWRVIPGHGGETTLERERKTNPFLND